MQEIKKDEIDDVSGGYVRLPGQDDVPGLPGAPSPFPGPGWPNPCPAPDPFRDTNVL
jgi:hypothetical protein